MISGIDVSTSSIAVVSLNTRTGALEKFDEYHIPDLKSLSYNKAERCRIIADTGFASGIRKSSAVYVEQPMGRQIKGVAEVERVVGSVIANVPRKVSVSLISPPEWKRIVGLGGNAGKDQIREMATAIYPVLIDSSQDLCDAAMIARACYIEGGS